MSMFQDWLIKKAYKEDVSGSSDPIEKFRFNTSDIDRAIDHDKVEAELFKIVMRKYPEESMDFFQTLAQRGDSEIVSLLKKLNTGSGPRLSLEPKHPSFDGDEVVPSSADTASNSEGGEEN